MPPACRPIPPDDIAFPVERSYTLGMKSNRPTSSRRIRAFSRPLLVLIAFLASVTGRMAVAAEVGDEEGTPPQPHRARPDAPLNWYYFIAAVNVYPRLESEDLIHHLLEPVLEGLSPGHPGVYTISDLRDDHLLWPPHLGLGVNLSPRWSAFLEAGYTSGKVRTKLDRTSILLLPLHTDFEIQRGALFAGAGLDFYPWGMAPQQEYHGWRDRLTQARPFLGSRLTWTRATYDAKVKLGLKPFPNFVNLRFSDAWTVPSVTFVAGVDVPLSRDTTLTFNGGYNFFWKQDYDFEGYAFTVQWRRYFRGPALPKQEPRAGDRQPKDARPETGLTRH